MTRKPCPACDFDQSAMRNRVRKGREFWHIACLGCGACGPELDRRRGATFAWNNMPRRGRPCPTRGQTSARELITVHAVGALRVLPKPKRRVCVATVAYTAERDSL